MRIAIVGGGRMGEALARGLLARGTDPDRLSIAETEPGRRRALEATLPGVRVAPNAAWVVGDAEVVVVATKPADVGAALGAALPALAPGAMVLSIAAGVTLRRLEALAPGHPVVRAMPNIAALVGAGAAAVAGGREATEAHLALAERILGSVGLVERCTEAQLDAVTGLSGSGPAYLFLVVEALIEAGVLNGLPRDVATRLAHQTLAGAAALLAEEGRSAGELRAAVTSPGGTTAAGLAALERRAVRAAVAEAVSAATSRSAELGREDR